MEKLLEELRLIRQAVERLTVDDTRMTRYDIRALRDQIEHELVNVQGSATRDEINRELWDRVGASRPDNSEPDCDDPSCPVDDTRKFDGVTAPVDDTRTTIQVWRDNRGQWIADIDNGEYRSRDPSVITAVFKVLTCAGIDTLDIKM